MHPSLSYYLAQADLRHYARSDIRICAVPGTTQAVQLAVTGHIPAR